ncbi:hypothetical protein D3C76_1470780 [compost metagenome]
MSPSVAILEEYSTHSSKVAKFIISQYFPSTRFLLNASSITAFSILEAVLPIRSNNLTLSIIYVPISS